jgi:hypothetical protein
MLVKTTMEFMLENIMLASRLLLAGAEPGRESGQSNCS